MDNNCGVTKIERDCPFCNKVHEIEFVKRQTQSLVKGEVVECIECVFRCPNQTHDKDAEADEWVSGRLMDENSARAHEAYKIKKAITKQKLIK